ncbi:TPA: hypothetical protein OLX94_002372 [Clostridioides difficile]|nr:hypothetical protein [Clostridioides difficile]EQF29364.1 hypothetical protein QEU_0926 [Clostridioides difficile CD159]CCL48010.1 hypothetical protein BN178_880003 [Clostridioides difficile T42]CCL74461.1 hypothetical protein BN185_2640001 [Clostridioides difficile E28]EJA6838619.1 hypothetical protein [Clostridioides difficile]MBY1333093.1 hypothetical protein [Clostridioides difficile]
MINDFTYHIVNIKTLSDAAKGAKDTAFTYHLVNITPTYIISFFTT